ncbi:uncharacterized protein LOC109821450 isoform X1 [Asparagus officinalis]|uniref:uncharacterized protein LOC109821450 isoform X1 n=1 Tax=Asparagus officinalis TaxID=4686 RepID=UPI00098E1C44|nr:uncharacterized protein LOC109821450 isoform X1 [Asparagus officinalis]
MDLDPPFALSSIFSPNSEPKASSSLAWSWVLDSLTLNNDSSLLGHVPTTSAVSEQVPLLIVNKEAPESDQVKGGAELFKHDLGQFVFRKRATAPKHYVDLLKDTAGKGGQIVAFSKAKTLMTGADQISHGGVEGGKAKKRKLNIQEEDELQNQISPSMDTDNSYKVLPGDPSGSAEQVNAKELELPNQISADPDYVYDKELQLVKHVSSTPSADGGKEILLEDTCAFWQQSNQRNSEEVQLQKHIGVPPFASISKELLQVHGPGLGQQSSHCNGGLTVLLAAAEAANGGKLNSNSDRIETGSCLKCDEGGSLLVCSGSDCLLGIHDKCIDSSVDFDEKGDFYCPLCSYKKAVHAYHKAEQKYSHALRVLASYIDKDWMRHSKELVSRLSIERESCQVRMDENIRCHGKNKRHQKNSKRVEPIIHHRISDVPGTTETSQYIKRTELPNSTGALHNEMSVDDCECITERQLQRQNHAVAVPDNRRPSCNPVHVDNNIPPLQVMPLTEVKSRAVNGFQSTELIKHRSASSLKDTREGYQSAKGRQIAEAKSTLDESYLAREMIKTSGVKEIQDISQANLVETCSVIQNKENQDNLEESIEQNINNLHPMKEICSLTARKCAKRKLKMQINNMMDDVLPDNVNLTCEKDERSRIVEAHALSQVNTKSLPVPPDKISEIQNQKKQEQATKIVEPETSSSTEKAVIVSPQASERYSLRKRLHTVSAQNQHAKDSGDPPFCDDTNGQNEFNNELNNKRTRKYWTPEEEKALKDAMQKISLDNGNIPWANIWSKIRHKFRATRQPGDLKDKWRNILIKEARQREKGSGD